MDASMWIAKTGLDAQQMRMSVISNNLANVNTTGFKRDRASFEDMLYQNLRQPGSQVGANAQAPTGLMMGTGVRIVSTEKPTPRAAWFQPKMRSTWPSRVKVFPNSAARRHHGLHP